MRAWLRQRAYRREHHRAETEGIRLVVLNDDLLPDYIGRRPWCDAQLLECPVTGHTQCCWCRHTEIPPEQASGGSR